MSVLDKTDILDFKLRLGTKIEVVWNDDEVVPYVFSSFNGNYGWIGIYDGLTMDKIYNNYSEAIKNIVELIECGDVKSVKLIDNTTFKIDYSLMNKK